jgi:hypothetical protein
MTRKFVTSSICALFALTAHGQGTFVYDQQSSDESLPGEAVAGIQAYQPIGQSFTPALSAVGFIRLQLLDPNPGNGLGAVILIHLRANSINGTILASTEMVSLPDGTPGPASFVNFLFSAPVAVAPNTTYYFQPVVQSGDVMLAGRYIPGTDYLGGTEYLQGQPGNDDLWFREGIRVPEPSITGFFLLWGILIASHRKHRS